MSTVFSEVGVWDVCEGEIMMSCKGCGAPDDQGCYRMCPEARNQPDVHRLIREDGRIEWACEHGVGHTVGHIDPKRESDKWMWVHGCDGCCSKWECIRGEYDNLEMV